MFLIKKWFFGAILILLLMFVSSVHAQQESLGTFQQGDIIQLGQICANCTYNNITSVYVQGEFNVLLSNVEMQKSGTEYNYTFNETNRNGVYVVKGVGDPDGVPTIWIYNFEITPNGEISTEANAIFYIGLLALLVIFFILFVYFGISTDHIWIKAASWGFGYLLLIGISFISWNMAADFLTSSPFLVEFLRVTFIVFMVGFFPFILVLFVYGVYMMITVKEIKSMMDRGIPEGEAVERSKWIK